MSMISLTKSLANIRTIIRPFCPDTEARAARSIAGRGVAAVQIMDVEDLLQRVSL
jgi:hypothetical protein